MRQAPVKLALVTGLLSLSLVGCAAWMGGREVAYDPASGTQTLAFQEGIYQTRGEALPLRSDQVQKVGTAEGLELYQLKGGGGGTRSTDILYVKTKDGRFQPMMRIQ